MQEQEGGNLHLGFKRSWLPTLPVSIDIHGFRSKAPSASPWGINDVHSVRFVSVCLLLSRLQFLRDPLHILHSYSVVYINQQEVGSDFTPNVSNVDKAFSILAPTRLVWHRDQAGIIPNSCDEDDNNVAPAETRTTAVEDDLYRNGIHDRDDLRGADEQMTSAYFQVTCTRVLPCALYSTTSQR